MKKYDEMNLWIKFAVVFTIVLFCAISIRNGVLLGCAREDISELEKQNCELMAEIEYQKNLVAEWQEVVVQRDNQLNELSEFKAMYHDRYMSYKTKYEEASLKITELEDEHERDMNNIYNYSHIDFDETAVKELFAWYLHKINNAERITVNERDLAMVVFHEYYNGTMKSVKENDVVRARLIAEEFMTCVENNMRDMSKREPGTFKVFEIEIEQGLDNLYIMDRIKASEKDLIVLEGALLKASN